ncbi:MAG: hypothetical protein CHKLHMKO_00546 [Candidatus Argoarchaeum ethanivorans]|uniref:Uncharacterized protein n=1 Tax=Candidatus Argoarchaeum ethanivorans TaxID=2608793 RepID=A0A811TDV0_9EURY|nr:MAG: hypothetical protein CHKLHMKO_00546 [Candidatus Argoarchaeum ethanivorans]
MSNMSQITDHTLLPAGRAVVVSHGVNSRDDIVDEFEMVLEKI